MAAAARGIADQGVVVAGGSSGIGLACAVAFAAAGARVAILGRSPARGAAAAESAGHGTRFIACDCGDPAALEAAVAEAGRALGRIDTGIVTLGGTHLPEILSRQSLAEVRAGVVDDLVPVLLAARALMGPVTAAGGGTILTVASDAAKIATPGEAVIGANMAAIVQFTRGLAIEGKRQGIRANCLTPSLVEGTPLTERLMVEGTFPAKLFAKARPLAQLGETRAEDLAALALFLASPAAARITGQAISVNGGISAA